MHKLLSVLLVVALASITMPVASAETVTSTYTGAVGARVLGVGPALMCPNACLGDDTGAGDMPNVGGAHLIASNSYVNVVVSVNDEGLWGTDAAITVCFWNPDGDNICDADDVSSGTRCSTAVIVGSLFASDYVTTWVRAIVVTEELDVCGGTYGTVSGTFF